MSILSNVALLGGLGALETILLRQGRSIAGIIPNVVINETHSDEMEITRHPVERDAPITDHAYKNPAQLTVTYGFGDKSAILSPSGPGSPQAVYEQFLQLQASRQPFDVVTGKRAYSNMLIKALGVTTDATTENVLIVTAQLQEIIIVDTRTTTIAPIENHATPEKTAPIANTGTKQAVEVQQSILYRELGGVFGVK